MPTKVEALAAPEAEAVLLDTINALRANPKKYKALKAALAKNKTDKARVKTLLKYATSDRQLAALMPASAVSASRRLASVSTVTVTTVFILEGSAY